MNLAVWVDAGRRRPTPAVADGDRAHANWGGFPPDGRRGCWPAVTLACRPATGRLVMRNRPEYLGRCSPYGTPVSWPRRSTLASTDEIAYILEHSESAIVVTDDDMPATSNRRSAPSFAAGDGGGAR
jgi:hypothetical protein